MVAVASVQSRVLSLERPSQARGRRHGCSVQQRRLVVRAAKTEPMEDVPFSSHNGASNAGMSAPGTVPTSPSSFSFQGPKHDAPVTATVAPSLKLWAVDQTAGRTLTSTIENIESWHQYNAQHPEEFKYGYDDRAHSWPKDKGVRLSCHGSVRGPAVDPRSDAVSVDLFGRRGRTGRQT
eukprot:scaffold1265_cov366-Prasinococcus_capsulatus_cf.AAC.8